MTKKDIVRVISEEMNLPQQKVKEVVQRTFDAIIDALANEGNIELRNFGVFKVRQRKSRAARNPRTGVEVWVEGRNVVTFKAGKDMEDKVQNESTASGSKAKNA
ncbi:MAG: HU family DNA-binding protein [Planctomycetia bacterium]|nr:HU family DNA-binding protein [Planctomycetia bacterium]